jgi:hypothetical protein
MAAGAVLAIVALIVVVLVLMLFAAMRLVPSTLGGDPEEEADESSPEEV